MTEAMAVAPRAWPRVKWTRAMQVAQLLDDGSALAPFAAMQPIDAFGALRETDPAFATQFTAQCLSRIDAIRWLSLSLNHIDASHLPVRLAAVKAIRRWLANPSDDARRLAHEAGQKAGFDTTEGMICLAIFLSGGSMAPATQEIPVNPPPGAFGKVVAGAILTVAMAEGGPAFPARIATLLDIAHAIAAGEDPS